MREAGEAPVTWPVAALVLVLAAIAGISLAVALARGDEDPPPAQGIAGGTPSAPPAPTQTPAGAPTGTPTATATGAASPTPAAGGVQGTYRRVSTGVIRIEVTGCEGGGVGSGFLLAPDLVATVAHVVDDAVAISLRNGAEARSGAVVGIDPQRDLALVRASRPFPGHVFSLGRAPAEVGAEVLAVGYPRGDPLTLTTGVVSAVGRSITVDGRRLTGTIQTDAVINPGNSGGPLLLESGEVIGLVQAVRQGQVDQVTGGVTNPGQAYAVALHENRHRLAAWRTRPDPPAPPECDTPRAPAGGGVEAQDESGAAEGPDLAALFTRWAQGINTGDYESSWTVFSSRFRAANDFAKFRAGNETSFITTVVVNRIRPAGRARLADVTFISVQAAEQGTDGQTCSVWNLRYTVVDEDGEWRIDRVRRARPGVPQAC